MGSAIATLALHVLMEAVRTRLAWVLAGCTLLVLGLARLAGAVALTESLQAQAALGAALLRLVAMLLVAGFVATSIARERHERGHEMVLALALPRAAWLLGKLAGFALAAMAPALLFGLLALQVGAPGAALVWSVSLLCELWIVAAFALLCANGLQQPLAALAATLAFYGLARWIGPLAQEPGAGWAIAALSRVLPHLDRFASADWLVYNEAGLAGLAHLAPLLLHTALTLALLTAAALVDLYRKNL